jgi:acetyltransferase
MTLMKPGNVSLVVQSGMLSAGFLMMILERGGMGIAKVCSIGNKCDVNETELLEYLVSDEDTGVIGMYLESIVDGRKFLDLARSTSKPVIVLKAGRSEQGARAAMSTRRASRARRRFMRGPSARRASCRCTTCTS